MPPIAGPINIKDLVDNPHPVYTEYVNYWNFLLESFEGGIDYTKAKIKYDTSPSRRQGLLDMFLIFVNGKKLNTNYTSSNLFPHPREKEEDFNRRVNMSYYYNFCSPIIDIYKNHLFKHPVVSDYGSIERTVDIRKDNIDGRDSSIGELRKEISELSQLYGHVFVLCDSPRVTPEMRIITLKDQMDNNIFPYYSLYHPQSVINWALDELGRPYWILFIENRDINADPFNYDKQKLNSFSYRLWTRDAWFRFNEKYDLVDFNYHGLGFVPVTCVFDKRSKKRNNFLGISFIADIAFIARDVYNSCSELRQILRDQTFAFLAIQGDSSEYSELTTGTCKAILYPEERNAPQYVSPPADNANTYFSHIDRQVTKIFQLAKIMGGSAKQNEQGAVEQSGVSKAWDFNETNSALCLKANNMEDGESKMWAQFAAWEGAKKNDVSIKYPNEFSMQTLFDDLKEAQEAFKLNMGKTFSTEVKVAIIKKKFPRAPEVKIKAMVEEVEAQQEQTQSQTQPQERGLSIVDRFRRFSQPNANSAGKEGVEK